MAYDFNKLISRSKYPPEWNALRNEIEEWATTHELPNSKVPSMSSYRDFKIAVYVPIKARLGINKIDDISADQVPIARKVFYQIKAICMDNHATI